MKANICSYGKIERIPAAVDTFRHTTVRRILNALITPPTRLGLTGRRTHILTVRGRKTGRRYSTPVQLVIEGGRRWLVAPYGEREWVKNARAAGELELTRALRTTRYAVEEVGPEEAAPVLREYLRTTPVVKRFFAATRDSPLEAFAAEAPRHPVFRLHE
jgi:deazaflavin-dependent oxidoreductase (nitroreductase family)